jgi:hypothetical protein
MSDRLPRRSLFALLASLPAIVVGLLTGRREVPALPAAPEQDLGALATMQLRHIEQMQETVRATQAEHVRLLEEQLALATKQNSELAAQQYRVLDLQQQMLDRQAERDLALSDFAKTSKG